MEYYKEVEAFQWFGDQRQTEDPEWIVTGIEEGYIEVIDKVIGLFLTVDGNILAKQGDYIIKDGEYISALSEKDFKKEYQELQEISL